jgi:hypothetical protein
MFTCNYVSKSEAWHWYVDNGSSRPILLEASVEIIVTDIFLEVELKTAGRGKGEEGGAWDSG